MDVLVEGTLIGKLRRIRPEGDPNYHSQRNTKKIKNPKHNQPNNETTKHEQQQSVCAASYLVRLPSCQQQQYELSSAPSPVATTTTTTKCLPTNSTTATTDTPVLNNCATTTSTSGTTTTTSTSTSTTTTTGSTATSPKSILPNDYNSCSHQRVPRDGRRCRSPSCLSQESSKGKAITPIVRPPRWFQSLLHLPLLVHHSLPLLLAPAHYLFLRRALVPHVHCRLSVDR